MLTPHLKAWQNVITEIRGHLSFRMDNGNILKAIWRTQEF